MSLPASYASRPQFRNQRQAADIQSDAYGWDNRQFCLKEYNFSPSILSACLAQQPPGSDRKLWATRCFHLADLGDEWDDFLGEHQYTNFTRRIIGVADCNRLRKFFEPNSSFPN